MVVTHAHIPPQKISQLSTCNFATSQLLVSLPLCFPEACGERCLTVCVVAMSVIIYFDDFFSCSSDLGFARETVTSPCTPVPGHVYPPPPPLLCPEESNYTYSSGYEEHTPIIHAQILLDSPRSILFPTIN